MNTPQFNRPGLAINRYDTPWHQTVFEAETSPDELLIKPTKPEVNDYQLVRLQQKINALEISTSELRRLMSISC